MLTTAADAPTDGRRPMPPRVVVLPGPGSTSPGQRVLARGWGEFRGHCDLCGASGDDVGEDDAWRWVDDHRCGVATQRPLQGPPRNHG